MPSRLENIENWRLVIVAAGHFSNLPRNASQQGPLPIFPEKVRLGGAQSATVAASTVPTPYLAAEKKCQQHAQGSNPPRCSTPKASSFSCKTGTASQECPYHQSGIRWELLAAQLAPARDIFFCRANEELQGQVQAKETQASLSLDSNSIRIGLQCSL